MTPVAAGEVASSLRVGAVDILPVYDGFGRVDARATIRRRTAGDAWAPHQDLLEPGGILQFPMGGFLVLDGNRRLLVDAGVGPVASPEETGGEFLRSLHALGYEPADVTDVLFTHLHSDHTGWAAREGRAVFPNATYRAHDADWRLYAAGGRGTGPVGLGLAPIAGRMRVFDADTRISASVTTRHCPGHTPGSTVFVVTSGGERALLIGDLAHSPAQFADRDWSTVWDADPAAAAAARNTIADEAAVTGDLIIPAHFPGLCGGHIVNDPRRFVASCPGPAVPPG